MQTQSASAKSRIELLLSRETNEQGSQPQAPQNLENKPVPQKDREKEKERRLAPRSSNQFRVGPPFSATVPGCTVYILGQNKPLVPKISARLDRGFDMIEGEWIGYKRNYFTLVASFQFLGVPLNVTNGKSFQFLDASGVLKSIEAFKISLTSVCLEDNATAVTLVQHTAKRDRGPQSSPPLYYAVPGELPAHNTMKSVANIRNGDKIDRCNRLFFLSREDRRRAINEHPHCVLSTYPEDCDISLVARYERIQFSSAGCGNRKSASTNNKHYILVVQLLGVTNTDSDVVLASTQSPPLIVRGRSPSNYPVAAKKESKDVKLVRNLQVVSGQVSLDEKKSDLEEEQRNQTALKKRKLNGEAGDTATAVDTTKACITSKSGNTAIAATSNAASRLPLRPLSKKAKIVNSRTKGLCLGVLDSTYEEYSRSIGEQNVPTTVAYRPDETEHDLRYPNFYSLAPLNQEQGLIIAQDSSFPLFEGSPCLGRTPSVSSSEGPINVNHSGFQTSRERCYQEVQKYGESMVEMEEMFDSELLGPYDYYSALPNPIVFPDSVRTSTPLELQVRERPTAIQPNLLRNFHPTVVRCKHGFKQRDATRTNLRTERRKYTFADLSEDGPRDSSFTVFKNKLAMYKQFIREVHGTSTPSIHSSPLTMLNSDQEVLLFRGLVDQEDHDC